MDITVEWEGKDEVLATLAKFPDKVDAAVARALADAAARLTAQIRANASTGYHSPGEPHIPGTGPGPNVATGDYRRSIKMSTGRDAVGRPFALVSTNLPQAARLEYGFTGTDARGRTYSQPPYPHWRPAIEALQHQIRAIIEDSIRGAR